MGLNAVVLFAAALAITIVEGPNLGRQTTAPMQSVFIEQPLPQK
jgi:hypothetical protein